MSDFGFTDPGVEEMMLMAQIASMRQGNPEDLGQFDDRLDLVKSIEDAIGVSLMQLAGVQNPDEQMQLKVPYNRTVYGSNAAFAAAFDMVDRGVDPISAQAAFRAAAANDPVLAETFAEDDSWKGVITEYAQQKAEVDQANMSSMAEFKRPDGSRYENAPLGGNDIYATASEYDLLGRPTKRDLMTAGLNSDPEIAQKWNQIGQGNSRIADVNKQNDMAEYVKSRTAGNAYEAFLAANPDVGGKDFPSTQSQPFSAPNALLGQPGPVGGGRPAERRNGWMVGRPAVVDPRLGAANQAAQSAVAGMSGQAGGGTQALIDSMTSQYDIMDLLKPVAQSRINQAQNTQVRSTANENVMRRLVALLGFTGSA